MKIMTFNIQHGLVWTKNEIKLGTFARYIKNQDPDFCGLNEVRGKGVSDPEYTNQAAKIGAAADYNNYFGQSVKIGGTEPYGNALLSKTPLKSAETVKIPDPDTDEWFEPRSVIKAVTEIGGKDICLLVSHFGLSDPEKENAVKTVCELLENITMPVVLMGDFNMTPDDPKLLPIKQRMNDADDKAVRKAQNTFSTYDPQCKIDYIFYRGLNCISCKRQNRKISDHFPIMAEFSLED
jgi:endonuclease/exonuclease/phosphatase family metal-dependent hydrolase